MVPEKKPLESLEDTEKELEALEQTSTVDEEAFVMPEDENSTVLTEKNGMVSAKEVKVLPLIKRRFRTIIALLIAVCVLVGGTIVVSLIPEKTEESETAGNKSITVKKTDIDSIEKIVVNGPYGVLTFLSKKNPAAETSSNTSSESYSTESLYSWELQGYDASLISSSSVNAAADSIATISATRVMENDQAKLELYGLNNPVLQADVFLRQGEKYTVTIGDASPDASGYYATVTGDPKIYLLSAGSVNNFTKSPEAMANPVIINTPNVEDVDKKGDKKYYDEDTGALATFDIIELSGPRYGQTAVITPIADNEFVDYNINLGTYSRYANPTVVDEMFGLMYNGLVAIETYALLPDEAKIAQYGLTNPEASIVIKYGEKSTALKATMYDKEKQYYAVMVEGLDAIYAVTADALSMLKNDLNKYYYKFVFQEYIHDFTNITVNTPAKDYSFDINYNSSKDAFVAKGNGQSIDEDLLSAYYQYFLKLSPEVKDSYADGEVAFTATFTFKTEGKGKIVLELVKQSARRYLVRINGNNYGIVNSTDFDNLVVYAEYVMTNKGIPEP